MLADESLPAMQQNRNGTDKLIIELDGNNRQK